MVKTHISQILAENCSFWWKDDIETIENHHNFGNRCIEMHSKSILWQKLMGVLKLSNRNFQKINENVQNIPCGKSMPCGGVIYAYEYCFLGSHPSRGSSIYQARRANNWKNGFFVAPKAPRKISEHSFRNFREIRKEKCNKKYFFGWFW